MGGKWLNLNYLIEPLMGSGNCSLWIKLLPKLREKLATALNAIFVPISMSYFNLVEDPQGHGPLVYTLFPHHCPYQFLGSFTKLIILIIDHVNALAILM